jgi:DNA repair exonuclease SbcCD nuclease subunit
MDSRGQKARTEDMPMTEAQLAGFGMDYIALGHHHGWKTFQQGERTFACYPGSPVSKSFRECGQRSVALVKLDGARATVEPIGVNELTAIEQSLDVCAAQSIEDVAAQLKRLGSEKLLARIHLVGAPNCVLNLEWLHAQTAPGFAFLDLVDETEVADTETLRIWESEHTIRGIFVRKMREKIKAAETDQKRLFEDALKMGALALARNKGMDGVA